MKVRPNELEIDPQNPLEKDALGRADSVESLSNLIKDSNGPYVLAIDAPWGTGKTTFVHMLKARLELEKFQCVYFNAWEVDYVTDPLVAMVSSLDEIVSKSNNFKPTMEKVKKLTTLVAKQVFFAGIKTISAGGIDVEEIVGKVADKLEGCVADDIVEAFQKQKEKTADLKSALAELVSVLGEAGKKETLVFFVDELDRCRPTFAIELLERLKHVFDIENVIFVLSVDKIQLEAATMAVYGASINASEYLRKFINLEFSLPAISGEHFTQSLVERFELNHWFELRKSDFPHEKQHFILFFSLVSTCLGLSLREQESSIARLKMVTSQIPTGGAFVPIVVAVLVALRIKNVALFRRFASGHASSGDIIAELRKTEKIGQAELRRMLDYLEATFIVADDDHERKESLIVNLKTAVDSANAPKGQVESAKAILQIIRQLDLTPTSMKSIIKHIDLAANIST